MKKKPISPENDLTLRLDEAMIDHLYKQWRSEFMDNPRPNAAPLNFIQYVETQIHADQSYRITGRDFIGFIQKLGGTNDLPRV